MPNQISSQLPGGPVHSPRQASFIAYYKESAIKEQWYAGAPIGFGYHDATTLKVFYRGAQDVNAVDEIRITLSAGTSHTDAAEWLIFAEGYGQIHPTSESVKKIVINGGQSMRPEFISCTITYGECCTGAGSGTMSNWTLSDGGTTQLIENSETVLFADSTYINNVVSAVNTVTTSLSATGTADATTWLRGDNTWAAPPGATYLAGVGLTLNTLTFDANVDGVQSVAPTASSSTAARTYKVQVDASDNLVVNVPWDDDTTYTAGDGLDLSGGNEFTTDLRANSGLQITSTELDLNLSASSITGTLDETDGGTGQSAYTIGDVLYASGTTALTKLGIGSNTNVLTLAGGVPTWAAPAAGGCADVYKTITGTTGSTVASGCSDTLTIQSPNSSIYADAATADTLKLMQQKYESFVVTLTDETRIMTTGIKYSFRIPYNFTIYDFYNNTEEACFAAFKIHVTTPPTAGDYAAITVNVESSTNNGISWSSVFTVKPSIDGAEWSSVTANTQPTIIGSGSGFSWSCDTLLRFTVDACTGAERGLKCIMIGYQPDAPVAD